MRQHHQHCLCPLLKWFYSTRKEFAPTGSKFCPYREDPLGCLACRKEKKEINVAFFVKMAESYQSPLCPFFRIWDFVRQSVYRLKCRKPFNTFFFFFELGLRPFQEYFIYQADRSSKVVENRRTRGKNHLTIRKQNLAFPHVTRARLEPQRWET